MEPDVLIETVKEYSFLFDPDDKRYTDKHKREMAWKNIGKLLKCQPIECKKQWNNLRDCFRRDYKKRQEAKEGEFVKKWRYRDEMSFMLPFLRDKGIAKSDKADKGELSDDVEGASNTSTPEQTSNIFRTVQTKKEQGTILTDPLHLFNEVTPSPTPSVWVDEKTESKTDAAPITILNNQQIYPPRVYSNANDTDIDLFFNSITSTVKQLSRYNQVIAKAKVFSIISELEIDEIAGKQ